MIGVDIELTNRCNAKCYFCPRDQTPHEGLITPETFEQALLRAVELREITGDEPTHINLCGLGEPLLNKRAAQHVAQVRAAGFECGMSSNGALLSEAKAEALLDAGLQRIFLNIGDRGEAYEDVYKLPWEKTLDNVTRFARLAEGRCEVIIVLVDHHQDEVHLADMRRFWQDHGITQFQQYDIMNRGGALFVDHMQYDTSPEAEAAWALIERSERPPMCAVPFLYLFVGYDGQYYLCCSDWKKEAPLGSVFDVGFVDIMRAKLEHVAQRNVPCSTCNLDPVNGVIDALRARSAGADIDVEQLHASMVESTETLLAAVERLVPGASVGLPVARRRIPLTAT